MCGIALFSDIFYDIAFPFHYQIRLLTDNLLHGFFTWFYKQTFSLAQYDWGFVYRLNSTLRLSFSFGRLIVNIS